MSGMSDAKGRRLVEELKALPVHEGWVFTYEFPGHFCYANHVLPDYRVFFTPDMETYALPIEVQSPDGRSHAEANTCLSLSRDDLTGQALFDLVRPTLDKLLMRTVFSANIRFLCRLTKHEIEALQTTLTYVRTTMAHQHSWETRDTAMGALGKVLSAATCGVEE